MSVYLRTGHHLERQTLLPSPHSTQDIILTASLKPLNSVSLFRASSISLGGNSRDQRAEENLAHRKSKQSMYRRKNYSWDLHHSGPAEIRGARVPTAHSPHSSGSLC